MASVNFTVLDIGHGNCTLINSADEFVIVDAAQGSSLLDILLDKAICVIESLIISHADADHIGGAISLLLNDNVFVKEIRINPDAIKKTKVWDDFRTALSEARKSRDTRVITGINSDMENLTFSDFELEILAPSPIDCLTGPGSKGIDGGPIDANSMSVVLRLIHEQEKIALITGDMDARSLQFIQDEVDCAKAKILIFPHHGGLPSNHSAINFSRELCQLVNPELVLISNARNKHGNPRNEIIEGIKQSGCKLHLACTQMSKECCTDESKLSNTHLIATFPSKGAESRHSCAGTVSIEIKGKATKIVDQLLAHQKYVSQFSDRKCR